MLQYIQDVYILSRKQKILFPLSHQIKVLKFQFLIVFMLGSQLEGNTSKSNSFYSINNTVFENPQKGRRTFHFLL